MGKRPSHVIILVAPIVPGLRALRGRARPGVRPYRAHTTPSPGSQPGFSLGGALSTSMGRVFDSRAARGKPPARESNTRRSEEHTPELQSPVHLVCRLLLEKKKQKTNTIR